jgi:hypothetical protein
MKRFTAPAREGAAPIRGGNSARRVKTPFTSYVAVAVAACRANMSWPCPATRSASATARSNAAPDALQNDAGRAAESANRPRSIVCNPRCAADFPTARVNDPRTQPLRTGLAFDRRSAGDAACKFVDLTFS